MDMKNHDMFIYFLTLANTDKIDQRLIRRHHFEISFRGSIYRALQNILIMTDKAKSFLPTSIFQPIDS